MKSIIEGLQGELDALRNGKLSAEAQLKSLLTNRQKLKELKRALANAVSLSAPQATKKRQNFKDTPKWYNRLVKT